MRSENNKITNNMKKLINVLLLLCICGLSYLFYASIMGPINFAKEKDLRDRAVINRLIDIRSAQVEYHAQHGGVYTDNFDTLIAFVKDGQLPLISKNGELTDNQLEAGWTESKVLALYDEANKAKKKKDADAKWQEAVEAGFVVINEDGTKTFNFSRDTVWTSLLDSLYHGRLNPDSLRYVPFGNGAQFEMEIGSDTTKSGSVIHLFEARTLFATYLEGLDKQEVFNLIDEREQLGRYPGMKVGDAISGNNNAGNWE